MSRFKVLGRTNEVETCECCGKTGLKMTVILGVLDADGTVMEEVYFGRDCAARATKLRRTGAAMEKLADEAQRRAEEEKTGRIVEVGTTCDALWVVESIGCNGGSITRLCFARGLYSEVERWAWKEFPNKELNVRKSIGGRQ